MESKIDLTADFLGQIQYVLQYIFAPVTKGFVQKIYQGEGGNQKLSGG